MATSRIFVLLNIFKLKDGVSADEDTIMTLREGLTAALAAKTGGRVVQQSFGITMEEPKKLYWLLYSGQGSQAMDEKLTENTYDLPDGLEAFPKGATSDAPVSEVVAVTLKEEVDIDDFMAYQDTITEAMKKEPAFRGIARSVPDREARTLWVIVGWQSKEAHMWWAGANGELLKRFGDSMHPKSGGMVHIPFTDL